MSRKLLPFILLCLGCSASAIKGSESFTGIKLYTQVNTWSIKSKVLTWANYHVDSIMPVNTEVVARKIAIDRVLFINEVTGRKMVLKNKPKRSGLDGLGWTMLHFGPEPVDLKVFTEDEREAIRMGNVRKGMSRDAVLVAFGYPPLQLTPDLKANTWVYWFNRRDKVWVRFNDDGIVSDVSHAGH